MPNYIQVKSSKEWNRPSDWLPIPSYGANEEVFYGLHAVWDTTINPVALLFNGTGAGYTVDWGDGTITNYAFNVKAEHNYVYANIPSNTECSRGYRQVIIKVTPQAGSTITYVNINKSRTDYSSSMIASFLEFYSNIGSNCTYQIIGYGGDGIAMTLLERIYIKNLGSISQYGFSLPKLRKITIQSINTGITLDRLFWDCRNLNIQEGDLPSLITNNISYIFYNSGIIDMSWLTLGATNLSGLFQNCTSLEVLPELNSNPVQLNDLFGGCYSLAIVPSINLSNATQISNWLPNQPTIRRSLTFGIKVTHSYANQLLDATALNEIF